MLNIFKKTILKQKMNENGYKWIKVKKEVIHKFRETTQRNKNLSDFEVNFKLVREFYSASRDSRNEDRDISLYGYLKIIKDNRTNTIIDIHNSHNNRNGHIKYQDKDKINAIYKSVFGGGQA